VSRTRTDDTPVSRPRYLRITSRSPSTSDSYDEPVAVNSPTISSGRLRRSSNFCPSPTPLNRPLIALPTMASLVPGFGMRPLTIFSSGRNAKPSAGVPRTSTFESPPEPSASSAVITMTTSPIAPAPPTWASSGRSPSFL
jgi:hypothetical protein